MGSLELSAEVVRPHLAKSLRDVSPEVRRSATRAVVKLGPGASLFIPDIILMAAKKENARSTDRLLRRLEAAGPDARSLPELVRLLGHDQERVRLLAARFLGLAGRQAGEAIPALEKLRDDPSAEVREQARAACDRIRNGGPSGPRADRARDARARV
jgi:HEAT repeat protein